MPPDRVSLLPRLTCDDCGCHPRKPAIDIALLVFCVRCAPRHGLFPGEHGEVRSYDEWKELAAKKQAPRPNRRYPEHAAKALVIDTSWSYCGACGRGAYPQQQAHIDVAGWTPIPKGGCGCRWEHVTSSYHGPGIKKAATDVRPDLKWIDLYPGSAVA